MASLFLLHGFTGSPQSFAPVLAGLPGDCRAIAPWLHGHGPLPAASGVRSFEDEVTRLASLVQRSGGGGSHLIGYSLGARVALGLLVRHPRLFRRATLLAPHPGLDPAAAGERRESDARWIDLLQKQGLLPFIEAWEAQQLLLPQPGSLPDLLSARHRERLSHQAFGLADSLLYLGLGNMPDLRPHLSRVRCPVSLILGERDVRFLTLWERALPELPRWQLRVIPGAGHPLLVDAPRTVARMIAEEGA